MTGADRLCAALLEHGVDICFANPGTSEMHFVAALDRRPDMRCVLGLFEGVVTGAADGYARMADRPAATLLHLGPGLANGLANMHNARRAGTPMINIVGAHSADHLALDAPLTSDIEGLAGPMSNWVRRMTDPDRIEQDVAESWQAAMTKGIATLILPADIAWSERAAPPRARSIDHSPRSSKVDETAIAAVAAALGKGRQVGLVLSGKALREGALHQAGRIASASGARLFASGANGRIERGSGRWPIERMSFNGDLGRQQLAGLDLLVLVDAQEPVAFFGYPGQSGRLVAEGCEIVTLASAGNDIIGCLRELADRLDAPGCPPMPAFGDGPRAGTANGLGVADVNRIIAAHLWEQAIVCDEAITSTGFYDLSHAGPRHDYLQLTGGAIGIGIPMAAGAALACPDRKVIALQADGSAMYTLQGLWTQARENLDVVTVIFSNRSYAILHGEMRKMGIAEPGASATRMLDIDNPALDWTAMARGMGVAAERAETPESFERLFKAVVRARGPFLIEAVLD